MDAIYAELNALLLQNDGFLTSISVTAPSLVTSVNVIIEGHKKIVHSKGAAEAILFGHLAEAFSNPLTVVMIQKYDSLMLFVRDVLEECFLIPMRSPKVSLRLSLWEVRDITSAFLHLLSIEQDSNQCSTSHIPSVGRYSEHTEQCPIPTNAIKLYQGIIADLTLPSINQILR